MADNKVYYGCTPSITACPGDDLLIKTDEGYTLELENSVWEELVVNMSQARTPASSAPTWMPYKGSQVPAFSPSQVNVIYFDVQIPHSYKEGTDLIANIHIAYPDNNAGDSRWYLTTSWANHSETFPVATSDDEIVPSPTTTDYHQCYNIGTISGIGKTMRSVLLCSIQRTGTHLDDTYPSDIYLLEMDFMYQKDTIGSRQPCTK